MTRPRTPLPPGLPLAPEQRDRLLALATERSPAVVLLLRVDGLVLHGNEQAHRFFALGPGELAGRLLEELPWGALDERGQPVSLMQRLQAGTALAQTGRCQVHLRTPELGRPLRKLAVSVTRLDDEPGLGHCLVLTAAVQDETPDAPGEPERPPTLGREAAGWGLARRLHAEETLRQSETRYRRVCDTMQETYFEVDFAGTVLEISPAIQRVTGYRRDELIGHSVDTILADPSSHRILLTRLLQHGRVDELEVQLRDREATIRHCTVTAELMQLPGQEDAVIVGSLRDVGERRQAAAERGRLEQRLRLSERLESLGRLAGGVVHDLNNLLLPIIGYSELALEGVDTDDPLVGELREIRAAGLRAKALIRQLLAFGRQQLLEARDLDLNEQVRHLERMLRRLIREDIRVELRLAPGRVPLRADPSQLDQILINLVVNAEDAMSRGGRLTIATALQELAAQEQIPGAVPMPGPGRAGRHVRLDVLDTGVGMSPELLARIFEPFFTTKAPGLGTGQGLATVYGIVQQHEGRIGVTSTPGVGTCFSVYLPLTDEAGRRAEPAARAEAAPQARHPAQILLVEDEEAVRRLTCRALERNGYRVLPARDAEEALLLAADPGVRLDLLLADVVLPGLNGLELSDRLVRLRPSLRVLFVSGYADDVLASRGLQDKAVDLLHKPFTVEELLTRIRQVLEEEPVGTPPQGEPGAGVCSAP